MTTMHRTPDSHNMQLPILSARLCPIGIAAIAGLLLGSPVVHAQTPGVATAPEINPASDAACPATEAKAQGGDTAEGTDSANDAACPQAVAEAQGGDTVQVADTAETDAANDGASPAVESATTESPQSAEALAKKLANPIASLISVPFQFNYDTGYGPTDGYKGFVNIQPVIPITLSKEWSLVLRTILPVAVQNDIAGPSGTQFGLGDTLQSFFFVPQPKETPLGTLTWGVGPVATWPTSTDGLLGSGTLGLGPTGIFLFQQGPWTYGLLAGQQWGVVETRSNSPELNNTYFQPFLVYTTKNAWSFGLNTEGSYNWTSSDLALPFNATVSKLTEIGGQKVQFQLGLRYWANSPDNGPEGFGARFAVTFLFPN